MRAQRFASGVTRGRHADREENTPWCRIASAMDPFDGQPHPSAQRLKVTSEDLTITHGSTSCAPRNEASSWSYDARRGPSRGTEATKRSSGRFHGTRF